MAKPSPAPLPAWPASTVRLLVTSLLALALVNEPLLSSLESESTPTLMPAPVAL